MNDIDYSALSVESKDDFIRFVCDLIEDYLEDYPGDWKCKDIQSYLEGISGSVKSTVDWLVLGDEAESDTPNWKTFAFILVHARAGARKSAEDGNGNA